jgi:kelch-like protein 10
MENEPPRPPLSRQNSNNNNNQNNNNVAVVNPIVNQAVARISQTDARDALARRTSSAISVASSMGDAGPDPIQRRTLSADSSRSEFSVLSDDSNDSNDLMTIALLNHSSISNQSLSSSIISRIGDQKFFEWRETYSSWKKFDEYRKQKLFTDVDLVVDGQSFSCHKAVLCASCKYFEALFSGKWKNGSGDGKISIPGVSAEIMETLIGYIYTKDVTVTQSNVELLLPAADQFGIIGVTKRCCEVLRSNICAENCIGIRQFALWNNQRHLVEFAQSYILSHIDKVSNESQEFLEIESDLLFQFLASDELNVKSEENAFEILIKWVEFDKQRRKKVLLNVLKTVRMGLMDPDYFMTKVKSHELVKENPELRPIIKDAMKALYDLSSNSQTRLIGSNGTSPYIRPRLPHEILFAVGGWSGGSPTNCIETYDCRAEAWVNLSQWYGINDERPRAYHGLVFYKKQFYIIGGFDGQNYFNSVRKFDLVNLKCTEEAPMKHRRCYVSCTILGNKIYALGGMDGQRRLGNAEMYDINKKEWTLLPEMTEKRSDADAAAMIDRVYIAGGFNGNECLNSVEFFSHSVSQWTRITPMKSKRSGVSLITLDSKLYAVGGFDGTNRLRSVEYYCPVLNTWQQVANMINPRSNFGIEVLDGQIIAVGGFNGFQTTFNVEAYDATTDDWYELRDMHVFRSALACCVVKDIPMKHMKDFAAPRDELV